MGRFGPENEPQNPLADRTDTQIRLGLRRLAADEHMRRNPHVTWALHDENLLEEAANRIQRYQNLSRLLGQLAPAGTAPRTALEQLYAQSATNADESPILLELRGMLAQHYEEWTPAIAEAEGVTPKLD